MKKYKITHKINADFIAEIIVNEDQIDASKGTESVTQTTYEEYDEKPNNSDKERTSD